MSDMGMEAPVDDAVEQQQGIAGEDEEDAGRPPQGEVPFDANEADAAEQDRTVELDENDYR